MKPWNSAETIIQHKQMQSTTVLARVVKILYPQQSEEKLKKEKRNEEANMWATQI